MVVLFKYSIIFLNSVLCDQCYPFVVHAPLELSKAFLSLVCDNHQLKAI